MIIKPSGYIVVVIVKSIVIDSTVHHITARNKMCYANKVLIKNYTQKMKTEIHQNTHHLHLRMVKLRRSPTGSIFYMTVEFQIKFKFGRKMDKD